MNDPSEAQPPESSPLPETTISKLSREEILRPLRRLAARIRQPTHSEVLRHCRRAVAIFAERANRPEVQAIDPTLEDLKYRVGARVRDEFEAELEGAMLVEDNRVSRRRELRWELEQALETARVKFLNDVSATAPTTAAAEVTDQTLSERDLSLLNLIGEDRIRNLSNKDLWRAHQKVVKKQFGAKVEYTAFRSMLNRIRKAKGLPSSEELRNPSGGRKKK